MHHPGGAIGKKLYLDVKSLAANNAAPKVLVDDDIKKVILVMTSNRLGATAVIDRKGKLSGIITDGDLRRMLEKNVPLDGITAQEIMTVNPKTITADALAVEALDRLRKFDINQLVVVTADSSYVGFIHLHDLIREGLI